MAHFRCEWLKPCAARRQGRSGAPLVDKATGPQGGARIRETACPEHTVGELQQPPQVWASERLTAAQGSDANTRQDHVPRPATTRGPVIANVKDAEAASSPRWHGSLSAVTPPASAWRLATALRRQTQQGQHHASGPADRLDRPRCQRRALGEHPRQHHLGCCPCRHPDFLGQRPRSLWPRT